MIFDRKIDDMLKITSKVSGELAGIKFVVEVVGKENLNHDQLTRIQNRLEELKKIVEEI